MDRLLGTAVVLVLAALGAALLGLPGALVGAALGAPFAYLAWRLDRLAQRLEALQRRLDERAAERELVFEAADLDAAPAKGWSETDVEPPAAAEADQRAGAGPEAAPAPEGESAPAEAGGSEAPAAGASAAGGGGRRRLGPLREAVIGFFTDGNLVARIGVLVLFFGVAFLLKYAAEHALLPIELRLSGAALGGLAVLAVGWRLRRRRRVYALLMQGAGVGVFYLTVFAAAKLYALLPLGLAFAVMVGLTGLSALLAVLQDARHLAAFGAAGGFLAPVLTAGDSGNHVLLFSYYALLNLGILGIAWHKAWRELNLLGFAFTFLVGGAWGYLNYRPELFASTEPFLVLHLVLYAAVAVLFAHRAPLHIRGYVDGTLVFGVPLVGFSLQALMLREQPLLLALSALLAGFFYVGVAAALRRRRLEGTDLLGEAFLAVGVVFATLAIPLALDGRWSAAFWALEGAGIVWIGLRQGRPAARAFGLLLQLGAGWNFARDWPLPGADWPLLNSLWLGSSAVALAGLFSAYRYWRQGADLQRWEGSLHWPALGWGLLWWLGGGWAEVQRWLGAGQDAQALGLAGAALSFAALLWLWRRLDWQPLWRVLPGLLVILAAAAALGLGEDRAYFQGWGGLAWPLAFAVQYRLLYRVEGAWPARLLHVCHAATLWLVLLVAASDLAGGLERALGARSAWASLPWGLVPVAAAWLLLHRTDSLGWPLARFAELYRGAALVPVLAAALLWLALGTAHSGLAAPLPYLPLLNPLELAQLAVLLSVARWILAHRPHWPYPLRGAPAALPPALLGLAAFLWLNGGIARSVHHFGGIAYDADRLFAAQPFQTSLSVVWTLLALGLTVLASRRGHRPLWFVGAGLLATVVAKLFLVDLGGSATMARILSFLLVGVLMLLIGYFSPIPPRRERAG